jgi:lipoprotein-releasing system permease protein
VAGGNAVIGVELARDLGVTAGDRIRVATAEGRDETFTVSGVFDLENKEINQRWVLVSLREAQTLLDLAGGVSTIEVKVDRIFAADRLAARMAAATGLVAESWMSLNRQLLVGLRSQNSSRYMIQAFVVVAVGLGISSVLVVWVVQKNREIGILRAMGTRRRQVLRVFLIQGGLLGLGGWAAGALLGTALALFFAGLARNADGSATFPVALTPRLYAGTLVLSAVVGLVAAVAPAWRASRLDPAKAIHHG